MPDKDPTAQPAWGAGEAGLAGYVPFNGPNSFYPPWKIPKPVDVPYSALGSFRNPRTSPRTWGLKDEITKFLQTWPSQAPPTYANRIPSAFHAESFRNEKDPMMVDSWPTPLSRPDQAMDKYGRYGYAAQNTGFNPLLYTGFVPMVPTSRPERVRLRSPQQQQPLFRTPWVSDEQARQSAQMLVAGGLHS